MSTILRKNVIARTVQKSTFQCKKKKKKEIHVKTLSSDFDTIIARNSKIRISNFKVVTAWRGTSIDYKYLVSI